MLDSKYCYQDSDVLINKFNIKDQNILSKMEADLTSIRVDELQNKPIKGKFDFKHLKTIHQYIFQDIYDWAGKERTVEIGKGNLFCTVNCIPSYAQTIFNKYYTECYHNRNDYKKFIQVLAENYGDLNALHPFREGNGRSQREFARELCLACGYDFNLKCTTHQEMLSASILSFEKCDNSELVSIFTRAVTPHDSSRIRQHGELDILTSDDLELLFENDRYISQYREQESSKEMEQFYEEKINNMSGLYDKSMKDYEEDYDEGFDPADE